jgi:hypothetical protein
MSDDYREVLAEELIKLVREEEQRRRREAENLQATLSSLPDVLNTNRRPQDLFKLL